MQATANCSNGSSSGACSATRGDGVELGGGPALKVGQAPVAGQQVTVADQQRSQVFDRATHLGSIQGGVAADNAATRQAPQGLACYRAPA
jgi:hypothetical protein